MGPFKGIVRRPYDRSTWAKIDWAPITPVLVQFHDIWLTQAHLNIEGVLGKRYSTDDYPRVVCWHEVYFLEDGHHRMVLAAARGDTAAMCRVRTVVD